MNEKHVLQYGTVQTLSEINLEWCNVIKVHKYLIYDIRKLAVTMQVVKSIPMFALFENI